MQLSEINPVFTFFASGHFGGGGGTARENLNQVEEERGGLVHAVLVVFAADTPCSGA